MRTKSLALILSAVALAGCSSSSSVESAEVSTPAPSASASSTPFLPKTPTDGFTTPATHDTAAVGNAIEYIRCINKHYVGFPQCRQMTAPGSPEYAKKAKVAKDIGADWHVSYEPVWTSDGDKVKMTDLGGGAGEDLEPYDVIVTKDGSIWDVRPTD